MKITSPKEKKEKEKLKKLRLETRAKARKVKKQFSRSKLIKEADRVFSLYIRGRDSGKPCCTCGAKWEENHQTGHFVSRRHTLTRWTDRNAHGQCPKCNLWGSGEQFLHSLHINRTYGPGQAEYIQAQVFTSYKTSDEEILGIIKHYYKLCFELGLDVKPKKQFLN